MVVRCSYAAKLGRMLMNRLLCYRSWSVLLIGLGLLAIPQTSAQKAFPQWSAWKRIPTESTRATYPDIVSIGDTINGYDDLGLVQVSQENIEKAADEAVALLIDMDLRQKVVELNFTTGQKHYSMAALRRYLEALVP